MDTIDYGKFINYAADYYYAHGQPNRGSMMRDAAKDYKRLRAIEQAARGLVEYRKRNTLNFQLEKADDYINELARALEGGEDA